MSSTKQINLNQIKKMEKQMKNTLKEITKKSIDNLYQGDVKEEIDYWFGEMVALGYTLIRRSQKAPKNMVEKFHVPNDKDTNKVKQLCRLIFGYNGVSYKLTPTRINLVSESAKNVPSSKYTIDHILGVTLVGEIIYKAIEELYSNGLSESEVVEVMVREWLSENLWMFATARITKEEHKKENLPRNEHTLEEKMNLVHYKIAKINLILE